MNLILISLIAATQDGSILEQLNRERQALLTRTDQAVGRLGQNQAKAVVISADGVVLTSAAGLTPGSEWPLTLYDGRSFSAKVVASSPALGLCYLKISGASDLPHLKLGSESDLQRGALVFLPGDRRGSLYLKQDSLLGRTAVSVTVLTKSDFLMLAESDPGDHSGMPILDLRGNVVGFIAQRPTPRWFDSTTTLTFLSPRGTSSYHRWNLPVTGPGTDLYLSNLNSAYQMGNYGYWDTGVPTDLQFRRDNAEAAATGVPVATIQAFVEAVRSKGRFDRGFLGTQLEKKDGAVRIQEVVSGSPAEKAGLNVGDQLLSVDGVKINSVRAVQRIAAFSLGKTLKMEFRRNNKIQTVDVAIEARPEARSKEPPGPVLGVEVMKMTDGLADYFRLEQAKGVIVRQVITGSAAEKAGLRRGDVIRAIDNETVDSVAAFRERASALKDGAYSVWSIVRDGVESPSVIKVKR